MTNMVLAAKTDQAIVAKNGLELLSGLERLRDVDQNKIYFKCDARFYFQYDLDIPMLFSRTTVDIGDEYKRLCALHAADPEHIVMPITQVMPRQNGSVVGYVMEFAIGTGLSALDFHAYNPKEGRSPDDIRNDRILYLKSLVELVGLVPEWHKKGVAHCDLRLDNVIVSPKGVKVFDPHKPKPEEDPFAIDMAYVNDYQKHIEDMRRFLEPEIFSGCRRTN